MGVSMLVQGVERFFQGWRRTAFGRSETRVRVRVFVLFFRVFGNACSCSGVRCSCFVRCFECVRVLLGKVERVRVRVLFGPVLPVVFVFGVLLG